MRQRSQFANIRILRTSLNSLDGYIHGAAFPGVGVATGDLDGDGRDDVIVTPATGEGSEAAAFKWSDKTGGLDTTTPLATSDGLFDGYTGGVSVAIGDYDGNGEPDVFATRFTDEELRMKHYDKSFAVGSDFDTPFLSGVSGLQVAMGDLDGDGADELLTMSDSSPDGLAHVFISNNKHKGWDDILLADEPAGVHVALGDVDGDGLAELVVGSSEATTVISRLSGIIWKTGW